MSRRKESTFKAGHYVVSRYNGESGELPVGYIRSVRRTAGAHVIVDDYLRPERASTIKMETLEKRYKRVSKKDADYARSVYSGLPPDLPLKEVFKKLRPVLVQFSAYGEKEAQLTLPLPAEPTPSSEALAKRDPGVAKSVERSTERAARIRTAIEQLEGIVRLLQELDPS